MSAIAAALALYFVHRTITWVTADLVAANLATGALGVSHLFWWYAVINETYALVALSLAAAIHAAVLWNRTHGGRHLALLALTVGLGISNHAMVALFAPGLVILVADRQLLGFLVTRRALLAVGDDERRHEHVLERAALGQQVVALEHEPDLVPADAREGGVLELVHGAAVEAVATGARPVEAADHVEEGRLARAGRPHDRDVLAGADRLAHVGEGVHRRAWY